MGDPFETPTRPTPLLSGEARIIKRAIDEMGSHIFEAIGKLTREVSELGTIVREHLRDHEKADKITSSHDLQEFTKAAKDLVDEITDANLKRPVRTSDPVKRVLDERELAVRKEREKAFWDTVRLAVAGAGSVAIWEFFKYVLHHA